MRKLFRVFALGFVVSWLWESLHSMLYSNYMGLPISGFILFRAALVDAAIISILIFIGRKFGKYKTLFILSAGFIVAVIIEILALRTGRWEYNSLMPIIPIIKTGLTPTIQLAMTAYLVALDVKAGKEYK
ncbi:MAG: hypothetical protein A2358_00640 [Candidatus Staskawiczbacteria bacterium RIFOXYB1_FULL_37_44]|uniref:Uncharacterized protein n=1 Tax=Candidatus Staskawiczbacteria bacterium RIFOXYB1_FULL_37_44 TaxID=1802223 RepID=A0A1G2IV78_9BACT|nr:MAG: hypothetical protein A2358_00640 [Candidatus Staskawiczbacteria bacterium RIFOXYB1_FULL_37_44]OGZ83936.1 MAG: hypothetical protein A2416_01535 [Candidatus Staskawiczbacteria bacterium RIFOXYC1_FULL_37_52]OGZ88979.1 MAG: hypothetical protein A2444_00585 [Candidatus Staskawiczbacteria bacterium RIFOXYC2_FULL_37_19]